MGAELFYADGQTDVVKMLVTFCSFVHKNCTVYWPMKKPEQK